ncbi:MAG: T9SS type A sorting domain-containing protein [Flavobacteriales bacterium]|nr:T9SS type A sorting domain-containing protein [Flavobacteriales bacterium]
MRNSSLLLLSVLALSNSATAQEPEAEFKCKNNDPGMLEEMFRNDPDGLRSVEEAQARLDAYTQSFVRERGSTYTIPVVFHVIHQNGTENISDAQIQDAVRILNQDFNKENPDWTAVRPVFLDRVADVGIEFRLAKRDPQGNCTNGITRTVSPLTNEGNTAMTQLIQWPRDRYMNVWVGRSANGAAGYTNYPSVLDNQPSRDGIVVQSGYVGSIGTSNAGRSRVLSHEVGHWLNLRHCWGNSNNPGLEENCEIDDGVDDTPLTKGWTSCALNSGTCGSEIDNVENYMEYSYCDKMFTNGQADRMIAALTSSVAQRSSLWQASNLEITGVYEADVLCEARFTTANRQVCVGQVVSFTDASINQVSERSWQFPGGEPFESTEIAPTVIYAQAGVYPVTLTVSDGVTTLTTTENIAVEVLPNPGAPVPYSEGFENATSLSTPDWTVYDADGGNGFVLTSSAAASGSQSAKLNNTANSGGRIDELISGPIDVSGITDVEIFFKYAFARRQASNNDLLRVYISNTCGATWSLRKQLSGITSLSTAPDQQGNFVPDADEWLQGEVTNISSPYEVSDMRFKFQFISDGGNYLYLDDININGLPLGLQGPDEHSLDLLVSPNPANTEAQLRMPLDAPTEMQLMITDAMGRMVVPSWSARRATGSQVVPLPIEGLSSGIYLVVVNTSLSRSSIRMVVDRGAE